MLKALTIMRLKNDVTKQKTTNYIVVLLFLAFNKYIQFKGEVWKVLLIT